jgi:uncharacterized membrane protein YagU involved in acid resistance
MTGMRVVTVGLGLLAKEPPEEVFEDALPHYLALIPPHVRGAFIELAHWAYGAAGGAAFALLPRAFRRHGWSGPTYGITAWAFFEVALAPALGLRKPPQRTLSEHAAILADHVLYGLVVAGRPRSR